MTYDVPSKLQICSLLSVISFSSLWSIKDCWMIRIREFWQDSWRKECRINLGYLCFIMKKFAWSIRNQPLKVQINFQGHSCINWFVPRRSFPLHACCLGCLGPTLREISVGGSPCFWGKCWDLHNFSTWRTHCSDFWVASSKAHIYLGNIYGINDSVIVSFRFFTLLEHSALPGLLSGSWWFTTHQRNILGSADTSATSSPEKLALTNLDRSVENHLLPKARTRRVVIIK